MTKQEILALAAEADVDWRIAADEAAHPERWREPAPNRVRERVRSRLRARAEQVGEKREVDGRVA